MHSIGLVAPTKGTVYTQGKARTIRAHSPQGHVYSPKLAADLAKQPKKEVEA